MQILQPNEHACNQLDNLSYIVHMGMIVKVTTHIYKKVPRTFFSVIIHTDN